MARKPEKIIFFKKLTEVGKTGELALGARTTKKILSIQKRVATGKLSAFERPYIFVALATCLEADVKYKYRAAMDIAGRDLDVFRKLYGESRIDIELLFHVVEDSISLADLVADATSVSDVANLMNRSEVMLGALSGGNSAFKKRLQKLAESSSGRQQVYLRMILSKYDMMVRDIETVFQMRHAIVHDATTGQGPIRRALSQKKISQVVGSCMAFQIVLRDLFRHAVLSGEFNPEKKHKKDDVRFRLIAKEVKQSIRQLNRKYPTAKPSIESIQRCFRDLISHVATVTTSFRETGKMSSNLSEVYLRGVIRLYQALLIEDTLRVK